MTCRVSYRAAPASEEWQSVEPAGEPRIDLGDSDTHRLGGFRHPQTWRGDSEGDSDTGDSDTHRLGGGFRGDSDTHRLGGGFRGFRGIQTPTDLGGIQTPTDWGFRHPQTWGFQTPTCGGAIGQRSDSRPWAGALKRGLSSRPTFVRDRLRCEGERIVPWDGAPK